MFGGVDVGVAVGGVCRLRADPLGGLVVQAHPDGARHGGVAGDPELALDELVACVAVAAQLLDGVVAVGHGAEAVVGLRHAAVLAEAEPDARARVEVGRLDGLGFRELVVGVGVAGVRVPASCGGRVAVAVADQHVRLAGLGVGDEERGLDGGVAVVGLLGELHVVADHLVGEDEPRALSIGLDDDTVLPDLEGAGLAVGQQVAPVGGRLLDGICAVGQRIGGRLGDVGPELRVPGRLDRPDGLSRLVELA